MEAIQVPVGPAASLARTRPEEPHDPANGLTAKAEGNPCNRGCEGDWPCAVRREQRADLKACVEYLHSDLYKRVPLVSATTGGQWESPGGWAVWLAYGERSLVGSIFDPDGRHRSSTSCASVQWLEQDLYGPPRAKHAGPSEVAGDGVFLSSKDFLASLNDPNTVEVDGGDPS